MVSDTGGTKIPIVAVQWMILDMDGSSVEDLEVSRPSDQGRETLRNDGHRLRPCAFNAAKRSC